MEDKQLTKALRIMRLAEAAAARPEGISLAQISETFGVNLRTAQRMTHALKDAFPAVETYTDRHRRKFWRLDDQRLLHMQGIRDSELAALDMGIRRAEREGAATEARALASLRNRLLATMPPSHARRTETDAEAALEARGHACRPGPRARYDTKLLRLIDEALKVPHVLTIDYASAQDTAPRTRVIEPHGLVFGIRCYLIARDRSADMAYRQFRLDRISRIELGKDSFLRDPGFELSRYCARSFGSFHAQAEYGPVVWRFAPEAADVARDFVFHPAQEVESMEDGSLIVRFTASGWLEMAWHLYSWGDGVEVISPPELRAMVEAHRRSDFPALP